MKRFVVIAAFILSVLGIGASVQAQLSEMESPLIGKPAPDFSLESVKNGKVSLTKLRDGKGAIVFFWATWCPHCRRQLGELNAQAAEIEKKGIKIILIDLGENAKQVSAYLGKQGINLDAVLDENSSLADEYGLVGVPTFYLIDKKGVVKAMEHVLPENYEQILSGG